MGRSRSRFALRSIRTIDREAIEKTGKLTIGDLVQELPNIAGAATNPTINNGGGSGASTIDLRGFGSQRTWAFIPFAGNTSASSRERTNTSAPASTSG